jgi:predicted DNA binding CopG/RHH family protein
VFTGLQGCFFYYFVIGIVKIDKSCLLFFKFAVNMTEEKVRITVRVNESFYELIAKTALRKGLTVPAFTRYVLKKYFNDAKKTNTNP